MSISALMRLAVVGALICPWAAAQEAAPYATTVSLRVAGEASIDDRVRRHMARELRRLPGVAVSAEQPEWILDVVPMELGAGARDAGVVVSLVVLETISEDYLRYLTKEQFQEAVPTNQAMLRRHVVRVVPDDDLGQLCARLIAAFDAEILDPDRRSWNELQELVRSNSNAGAGSPARPPEN